MYDEKLIQDFYKKYPKPDAPFWYDKYLKYCIKHKIEWKRSSHKEYEQIMEKVYREDLYGDEK